MAACFIFLIGSYKLIEGLIAEKVLIYTILLHNFNYLQVIPRLPPVNTL